MYLTVIFPGWIRWWNIQISSWFLNKVCDWLWPMGLAWDFESSRCCSVWSWRETIITGGWMLNIVKQTLHFIIRSFAGKFLILVVLVKVLIVFLRLTLYFVWSHGSLSLVLNFVLFCRSLMSWSQLTQVCCINSYLIQQQMAFLGKGLYSVWRISALGVSIFLLIMLITT